MAGDTLTDDVRDRATACLCRYDPRIPIGEPVMVYLDGKPVACGRAGFPDTLIPWRPI